MFLATTVHTSGINWASVLTIVCSIVGALAIVFGFITRFAAKYISREITASIDKLRVEIVSKMETRISLLEMAVFGRKVKSDNPNDV
jgi:hypothetical protein